MKIKKIIITTSLAVAACAVISVTAFAASRYKTPAEAVAGLIGWEVQDVIDERIETGKTYGTIANEAGVLEEFQAEVIEIKKDCLSMYVADGTMTQEQADMMLEAMVDRQSSCNKTYACAGCVFDGSSQTSRDILRLSGQGHGGGHCYGRNQKSSY